jgi:Gas vesicle synthesis protein GvpL/GvpF/Lsr2
MATVTQVTLTCDVCGDARGVRTRAFGLDGKAYQIDLCPKDSAGLSKAAADYTAKSRKITARKSSRRDDHRPRRRAKTAAIGERDGDMAPGKESADRGRRAGSARREATASRPGLRTAEAASELAAGVPGARPGKGVYVYGILPADIELAGDMPGVGEHPGLLRVIRSAGLAALVSEVDLSARPGSPDDRRTHREILDATASEVPVVPLRFGTILSSEDTVAGELLAARRDEFADALDRLDGRAEFLVKCRYVKESLLDEVASQNMQAARLRDTIDGDHPDAARDARIELGEILKEQVAATREEDTRALEEAMEGVCVASVARAPTHDLDAAHVAFLVAADQENEMQRVIDELAREWEGRIDLHVLGPMAAYHFAGTAHPKRPHTPLPGLPRSRRGHPAAHHLLPLPRRPPIRPSVA